MKKRIYFDLYDGILNLFSLLKNKLREESHKTTAMGRTLLSIRNFFHKTRDLWRDFDPLAWLAKRMSSELILILGCQRSGTTLLYMLLTSHPGITGKDESENRNHSFAKGIELVKNHICGKLTCLKLPRRTSDLKVIRNRFPRAKIIWITRNPFAVVSSMKGLFSEMNKKNWLQVCGIQELERHAGLFPEINERDVGKNNKIKLEPCLWEIPNSSQFGEVKLGAYIWKCKMMAYEECRRLGLKTHLVKYEELVKNPKAALLPVLEFIGCGWDERILHHEIIHRGKRYAGNNKGDKPVDVSRENPKLNLTKEEEEIIKGITGVDLTI